MCPLQIAEDRHAQPRANAVPLAPGALQLLGDRALIDAILCAQGRKR